MRKISEWLYRFAQWFERRFIPEETVDEFLARHGFERRGDEIYLNGQLVGRTYEEPEEPKEPEA